MHFPSSYKKALINNTKNTTIRVGDERGKYTAGTVYDAHSYSNRPMGVQVKVQSVTPTKVSELHKHGIPPRSVKSLHSKVKDDYGDDPDVEVIKFRRVGLPYPSVKHLNPNVKKALKTRKERHVFLKAFNTHTAENADNPEYKEGESFMAGYRAARAHRESLQKLSDAYRFEVIRPGMENYHYYPPDVPFKKMSEHKLNDFGTFFDKHIMTYGFDGGFFLGKSTFDPEKEQQKQWKHLQQLQKKQKKQKKQQQEQQRQQRSQKAAPTGSVAPSFDHPKQVQQNLDWGVLDTTPEPTPQKPAELDWTTDKPALKQVQPYKPGFFRKVQEGASRFGKGMQDLGGKMKADYNNMGWKGKTAVGLTGAAAIGGLAYGGYRGYKAIKDWKDKRKADAQKTADLELKAKYNAIQAEKQKKHMQAVVSGHDNVGDKLSESYRFASRMLPNHSPMSITTDHMGNEKGIGHVAWGKMKPKLQESDLIRKLKLYKIGLGEDIIKRSENRLEALRNDYR